MTEHLLQTGTWIAVCDGTRALLFENVGDHVYPKLETRETLSQDNPPAHMQGASAPGRVFGSAGRRSAVDVVDHHDLAEQTFLRDFAQALDRIVNQRRISRMVVVAPPRALGHLRQTMPAGVRRVIVRELDHDYTHLPSYEIERLLMRA
jgi:protein required for attachment to host cells